MDFPEAMTTIFHAHQQGTICSLYYAQTKIADTLAITSIVSDIAPYDDNPPTYHIDMKYIGNNFTVNSSLSNMMGSLNGRIDACCCFLKVGDEQEMIPIFVKQFSINNNYATEQTMGGGTMNFLESVDIDIRAILEQHNFGLMSSPAIAPVESEPDEKINSRLEILDL